MVGYLSIKVVNKTRYEVALNVVLIGEYGEVVSELIMCSDDCATSWCVKLRPSSSAKDLKYIQYLQVHKRATLWVIHFCTLKQHSVKNTFSQTKNMKQVLLIGEYKYSFLLICLLSNWEHSKPSNFEHVVYYNWVQHFISYPFDKMQITC